MSRELERARQRYAQAALNAQRVAALNFYQLLEIEVHISGWTRRAADAYRDQLVGGPRDGQLYFDWEEIFRIGTRIS